MIFQKISVILWSLISLLCLPNLYAGNKDELWQKYLNDVQKLTNRKNEHEGRALSYNGFTMKFSMEKIGAPGAHGYPLYIALHGGGGAPAYINDSQWEQMKIYYKDSVKNGIYVAPRGITNTWNLHFVDESYPLYDRLIENMILFEGVDPNRVYLLGFSAGGDGVYQVVPRMADRFAAANMSAGHNNGIKFDNLYNTPFLIQVGENDSAYKRNTVAAENYLALQDLNKKYGGGYISDIFIHVGYGHNGWPDNSARRKFATVIANPQAWLKNKDRTSKDVNANAIDWVNQFTRNPKPSKIVWDLSTIAKRTAGGAGQELLNIQGTANHTRLALPHELFYWLDVSLNNPFPSQGKLVASLDHNTNTIHIEQVKDVNRLRILLSANMLDLNKPINIKVENKMILTDLYFHQNDSTMIRTMLERSDKNFIFDSELVLMLNQITGLWEVIPIKSNANEPGERFSYCSNGSCKIITTDFFYTNRGMPRDLNFSCKKNNQYALTFDDGPSANYPRLIEILKRHNVSASFFGIGTNLQNPEHEKEFLQAALAGHFMANHTWNHADLTALSTKEIFDQIENSSQIFINAPSLKDNPELQDKLRISTKYVRPPYGNIDGRVDQVFKAHGFTSVRWNSDRYDWQMPDTPETTQTIVKRVRQHLDFIAAQKARGEQFNTSILDLNHDFRQATLNSIDEVIPLIKARGYEFVTLDECLL